MEIKDWARVLVLSDDPVLGTLISRTLRQRGNEATRIDLNLALASDWSPACGVPDLIILDLEAADRVDPSDLGRLLGREWLAPRLARPIEATARPSDVGGIVAAVLSVLKDVPVH